MIDYALEFRKTENTDSHEIGRSAKAMKLRELVAVAVLLWLVFRPKTASTSVNLAITEPGFEGTTVGWYPD